MKEQLQVWPPSIPNFVFLCVSTSFSVSLRNLKHFDCEEKQDLIVSATSNPWLQCIQNILHAVCAYPTGCLLSLWLLRSSSTQ